MTFQSLKEYQRAATQFRIMHHREPTKSGHLLEEGTTLYCDPNSIMGRHWVRGLLVRNDYGKFSMRLWFEDEGTVWELA